jgi:hypothetical protein
MEKLDELLNKSWFFLAEPSRPKRIDLKPVFSIHAIILLHAAGEKKWYWVNHVLTFIRHALKKFVSHL